MTTLSTNLLGRKLFERISSDKEVNGSFSGMTLHQFLNKTGNSHLFIKKDGMVAINTLLEQSGLKPISYDEALVAMEDLKMTSLRSQFGFSLNQPNINVKIQKFWYVWETIERLCSIAITLIMATWLTWFIR